MTTNARARRSRPISASALACLVALGCGGGGAVDANESLEATQSDSIDESSSSEAAGGDRAAAPSEGGAHATEEGGGGSNDVGSDSPESSAGAEADPEEPVTAAMSEADPETEAPAEPQGAAAAPTSTSTAETATPQAEGETASSAEATSSKRLAVAQAPACPNIGLNASKVHYVCDCQPGADASCKPGDDAGDGTQSAPFRTYQRAQEAFNTMSAGQTVALCRGGSFKVDGERRWVNDKCRKGQPCVVRDYVPAGGKSTLEKPILTAASGDAFALDDSTNANHEEGYTFLNLDVRSTSKGKSGNGFFIYNDIDDVNICGTDVSGFDIGVQAAGSNPPEAGSDGENARLVISNSTFKNNGSQGVLAGCDGCGVQYSKFENNGFNDPNLDHNIYFGPRDADGMFALHNDLYKSTHIDGKCQGVSLVVHGRATNLRIEGNTIREDVGKAADNCWGIAVDTGYAEPEGFKNVQIRGNTVVNVGNTGIGLNACQDCVIENNVITHQQPIQATLIAVADRERDSNDLAMTGVKVQNNTLHAKTSTPVTGISLGTEGAGHVAKGNALLSEGSGPFTCFDYGLPGTSYSTRDNNLCHASKLSWTPTTPTLEAFRSAHEADQSSLDTNPQFASTGAPFHFTPKAGSPLLAKGIGARR